MSPDVAARAMLPIPGPSVARSDDVRREGPGHRVPSDRATAPAQRGTERRDRPVGRRGLRCVEHVRRPVPHADGRPAGSRRAAVQPVPHHRTVRADPAGTAHRAQPPLGGDGQHHRDRHLGPRQQLAAPEHQDATGDEPQAQRVLDGAVRQVPRGPGLVGAFLYTYRTPIRALVIGGGALAYAGGSPDGRLQRQGACTWSSPCCSCTSCWPGRRSGRLATPLADLPRPHDRPHLRQDHGAKMGPGCAVSDGPARHL